MLFACDYNDNLVHIDETHSNQEYYCPSCGAPLSTRKGNRRGHCFAHKPSRPCSDSWERSHSYDVSPWHKAWQSLFPRENQEVKLTLGDTKHRADVLIDRTVVEFQHSIMPVESFDDRNNFYFNLGYKVIWLFDLSDLYEKRQLSFESTPDGLVFAWKNPKKSFNNYDIQSGCIDLFFQLNSDMSSCIVRVTDVSPYGFESFHTTNFMSQDDFLTYVGLQDGLCLPPCRDDLEKNQQYRQFCEKYQIHLNKQQERALQTVEGSNLLLAVPGSGKTTVLVARLGHMVLNKNISPENILAVTYNRNATEEMRERFSSVFGSDIGDRIDFQTINSLSLSIYREYCQKIRKIPRWHLEESERRRIIRRIYKDFHDTYASESDVLQLASAITYIKNMMLTEEQILEIESDYPQLRNMYRTYQSMLDRQQKMDFDDQMAFALQILHADSDILSARRSRYRYICVDEAQDTSKIQHEIIRILAQGNNLFMVGDEDQSIYGFRAAYPKALLNFRYDYLNPYILRMERNYRSTPQIVAKAQAFISLNQGRFEKNMTAERGNGEDVHLECVHSREAQYQQLLNIAQTATAETAFLYRDNESAVVLVDLLLRNGIPFKLRRPEINFFGTGIVKDIVAYLKLAINAYDAQHLDQICNKGIVYLKKNTCYWVIRSSQQKRISIYDALEEQIDYVKRSNRDSVLNFRNLMGRVAMSNPHDAISLLLGSGYARYIEKEGLDKGKIELLQILAKQESTISSFMNRLQFLERSMQQGFDPKPGCRIVLSTIHSSKGLEYDNVYMVDVYDGRFPSSRPNLFSRSKDSADGEQEERRLFYVGITRAKNRLQLFEIQGRPSTFINDLFPERRRFSLQEEEKLCALQLEEHEDIRHKQIVRQTNQTQKALQKAALAEQARSISMLREEYRNLPVKNRCKVEQILSEDYDQENYLIFDQLLGFRWMKCTKCGGVKKEREIAIYNTCNKGICIDCASDERQDM